MDTLQAAVPMLIREVGAYTEKVRQVVLERWISDAAIIDGPMSQFDVMMYGGTTKSGGSAPSFNYLVRAITALAHSPGGVAVAGVTFCASHWPGGTRRTDLGSCPQCLAEQPDCATEAVA